MKSKTSCFNGTLFRRTLQRGLPLWGIYLLLMLVTVPAHILSFQDPQALWVQQYVLKAATMCHMAAFFYGPAVALLVFSHLYKSTSANFFGALPLTRTAQFNTQYLAGLTMCLLPNALVGVLTLVAGGLQHAAVGTQVGIFFAAHCLTFLFYYSFACLVAVVTGNLMAMPILYMILNFVAVVVEMMVKFLLETFMFGLTFHGQPALLPLSPFANAVMSGNGPSVEPIYHLDAAGMHTIDGYMFTGWQGLLILAAVGVVFAVLAFLIHRFRRMESAGDVIAIRHLKGVALYCFTFGCALVLGIGFHMFLGYNQSITLMAVCMIVGGGVGYFLGEMILHRSLRVFRKKNLINCVICAAIIVAGLLCIRLDLLGLTEYVPEPEDVASCTTQYQNGWTEDPEIIDQVLELHHAILENRDNVEMEEDAGYYSFYLNYRLKNGKQVTRRYNLPAYKNDGSAADRLIDRYIALENDPDYIVQRAFTTDYELQDISECHIYSYGNYGYNGEVFLTKAEAMEFFETALVPDLRESSMKKVEYRMDTMEWEDGMPFDTGIAVDIAFKENTVSGGNSGDGFFYFSIPSDATRVIEYAMAHGVEPTNEKPINEPPKG